jgi:Na+/melibiose symporter-like transporter
MPTEPKFEIKSNLVTNLKKILKNRNFLLVTLMQGITGIALSMITAIMLMYAEVVLNLGGFDYIIIAVFLLLGIFIFLYIWRKMIGKKGKKQTLLYIFLVGIIFLPITLLGIVMPGNLYLLFGVIFILIIAAILGGWYLFPYIMYADLAEDDEKSTGELKAGIFTGFPSIVLNIFQALGIFILGIIVSLPNISVGPLSYSIGLILWGPVCSVVLIGSYLYTKKFVVLDFEWEKRLK